MVSEVVVEEGEEVGEVRVDVDEDLAKSKLNPQVLLQLELIWFSWKLSKKSWLKKVFEVWEKWFFWTLLENGKKLNILRVCVSVLNTLQEKALSQVVSTLLPNWIVEEDKDFLEGAKP